MSEIDPETRKLLDDIDGRLSRMEDNLTWLVRAEQRFKVGQRVRFSPRAHRKGLGVRTKGGVQKGVIKAIEGPFSIRMLLDGYKHPSGYHHMLFDPIGRRR